MHAVPDLNQRDTVILLSAYSDQNWINNNITKARELNVGATKSVIDEVRKTGACLIFLSSEAVFGADTLTGWSEEDEPNPVTEYGRQKLAIERYIKNDPVSTIIRTGWVVGWECPIRCPILHTYNFLLEKFPKIAADNFLTLTNVNDLVNAIFKILYDQRKGIFHLVSTPFISRLDIANCILNSTKNINIKPFEVISFNEANVKNKKAGMSWLRPSQFSINYCKDFMDPQLMIREKVKIIDDYYKIYAAQIS
jgi:dTDP-4-dehydrorhamnose reductase